MALYKGLTNLQVVIGAPKECLQGAALCTPSLSEKSEIPVKGNQKVSLTNEAVGKLSEAEFDKLYFEYDSNCEACEGVFVRECTLRSDRIDSAAVLQQELIVHEQVYHGTVHSCCIQVEELQGGEVTSVAEYLQSLSSAEFLQIKIDPHYTCFRCAAEYGKERQMRIEWCNWDLRQYQAALVAMDQRIDLYEHDFDGFRKCVWYGPQKDRECCVPVCQVQSNEDLVDLVKIAGVDTPARKTKAKLAECLTPRRLRPDVPEYVPMGYVGNTMLLPPIMRSSKDNDIVFNDPLRGLLLRPYHYLSGDRMLEGFFSYFKLSDILPLFFYFGERDRNSFVAYFDELVSSFKAWRGRGFSQRLWCFMLARKYWASEVLSLRDVDVYHINQLVSYCQNRTTCLEVLETQGPLESIRNLAAELIPDFGIKRRFKGVRFGSERLKRESKDMAMGAMRATALQVMRKVIGLEAALHFWKSKMYKRAFGQLWLMLTDQVGAADMMQKFVESTIECYDIGNAPSELWFNQLEEESQAAEVEVVLNDDVPLITPHIPTLWDSQLWKKFMLLLTSVLAQDFVKQFPSAMQGMFHALGEMMARCGANFQVGQVAASFVVTFAKKCKEFSETYDWRVFLSDGGFDTYPERCQAVCLEAAGAVKQSAYFTLTELLQDMRKLIAEGNEYYKSDSKRELNSRKWTPVHTSALNVVTKNYSILVRRQKAVSQRSKKPCAFWVSGPPGVGKTTSDLRLLRFYLKGCLKRPTDAKGNPIIEGSDSFAATMNVPHWTGCTPNCKLLSINDLRGDGYTNNGSMPNAPELLRLAVDVEPFYTPQASIEDKENSVIDPAIVTVSSNDMIFNFSIFGTNWSKLIRRFPTRYYLAYPAECYKVDIEAQGDGHGELLNPEQEFEPWMKDKMRVYSMTMTHSGGRIFFKRDQLLGLGMDFYDQLRKAKVLEWYRTVGYDSTQMGATCCMDTTVEGHCEEQCFPGCDIAEIRNAILTRELEVSEEQTLLRSVAEVQCFGVSEVVEEQVQVIADKTLDRMVDRRGAELRKKFGEHMEKIGWWCFLGAAVLSFAVTSAIVWWPRKVDETQGNVINPIKQEFTQTFVDRFGVQEASAVEIPNPPKYPNNSRAYVTMSPVSATSSFKDVQLVVNNNFVKLVSVTNPTKFGFGLFLSSELMLMNEHVARYFGDDFVEIVKSADNDLTLRFQVNQRFNEGDFAVVKTPTFPASNILNHIATDVGSQFDAVIRGESVIARRLFADFKGKADLGRCAVLNYTFQGVKGDCGSPLVASIDGKGVIVGIHVAKLVDGSGASLILDRKVIVSLVEKHKVKPTGFVGNQFATDVDLLHGRSRLRSAKGVSMCVLGTLENPGKLSKSRIVETELLSLAKSKMKKEYCIPQLHIDGTHVDGEWKAPYVHKFHGMSISPGFPNKRELENAMWDYLRGAPIARLSPLPLSQVINGVYGDHLLKAMNLKTSMGVYQRFYPDKSFLVDREFVSSNFAQLFENYCNVLVHNVVFEHQKWALKDELVTVEKEGIKKYRYFMVNDFLNLFAFRCFVAPLVAHMYRDKKFFEAYGAFNPASPEFGTMYQSMYQRGNLIMADLKHMDSSHRSMLIDTVGEIFAKLAEMSGYKPEAVAITRNLVRSIIFTLVELNGDVAFMSEGMGSGVYVTFIVNCLVLCILYRVAWYRVSQLDFRTHNDLAAGGDDSALGTDESNFTGTHVQRVFSDYGYELSPPTDKSGLMCEFFDWKEFVFLKRSPKLVDYGGGKLIVGALDTDSVWKSLGWEMPSKEVSHLDRMSQVLDAAQRELSLHGEDVYNEFHLLVKPYGLRFRYLTYSQIIDRYVVGKFYDDVLEKYIGEDIPVVDELQTGDQEFLDYWDMAEKDPLFVSSLLEGLVSLAVENKTNQLCDHSAGIGSSSLSEAAIDVSDVLSGPVLGGTASASHSRPGWASEVENSSRDIKINGPANNFIGNDSQAVHGERTATFNLASNVVSSSQPYTSDPDYGAIRNEIDLPETLSRPTYLFNFDWSPLSPTHVVSANIYDEWKNDNFINSKLVGFKFFKGRPCLRFVVNGFSFYYGKLVCAVDLNPGRSSLAMGTTNVNSFDMKNVTQALMAPHVAIDPSQSVTYDLDFPFYSSTGWFNRFAVPGDLPTAYVNFFVQNTLASANDVPPTFVNVKVYLIMKDIELSVPAVAALFSAEEDVEELHGGKENAPNGTISKPAMAVSRAAGSLKAVPMLAPFAGPLEIAAGTVGSIASMLGFSKPVILEESRPTLNLVIDQPTYSDGRSAVTKLTADPKQEVAVTADAAMIGGNDDMLISNITRRFGYVGQAQWSTSGYVDTYSVNPMLLCPSSGGGWSQLTPVGFVTSRFQYWTGSLVFRIEIVASGFHRGAIGVSWVPYLDPPGGNVLDYPNRFLTKIIDITQTKTVDFVVPFAGDFPNLLKSESNGALRLYEVNPLRSSGSTTSVGVNVYLAAGEDFELFRPGLTGQFTSTSFVAVDAVHSGEGQVAAAVDDDQQLQGSAIPEVVQMLKPGRDRIYFGETFSSIKQMCNRHCLNWTFPVFADDSATFYFPLIPYPYGANEQAIYALPLTTTGMTFQAWFAPAFLAMRGGFRFKMIRHQADTAPDALQAPQNSYLRVNTFPLTTTEASNRPFAPFSIPTASVTSRSVDLASSTSFGTALTTSYIHSGLEYEVPYILPERFANPRKITGLYKYSVGGLEVPHFFYEAQPTAGRWDIFSSAADDFSLHYFMFVPEYRVVSQTS